MSSFVIRVVSITTILGVLLLLLVGPLDLALWEDDTNSSDQFVVVLQTRRLGGGGGLRRQGNHDDDFLWWWWQRRRLDEPQVSSSSQLYTVPIVLALHFVSEATAVQLETREDPGNNPAVAALCHVVQSQAAGSQVRNAAALVNVTIQTNSTVNECVLSATNRAYDTGAEILGPDYLSMELVLEQVVYVTTLSSSLTTLTDEQVYELVENGFNRGSGGRVRTRNLLLEYTPFEGLLDVQVLPELATSMPSSAPSWWPTPSPTGAPTTMPTTTTSVPSLGPSTTAVPSMSPSVIPTSTVPTSGPTFAPSKTPSRLPSLSPTGQPTFVAPTLMPSSTPSAVTSSLVPTLVSDSSVIPRTGEPTVSPSGMPSAPPTNDPGAATDESNAIEPGVIAAIAGGSVAAILACCFSGYLCATNRQVGKHGEQDDARAPIHPQGATTMGTSSASGRKRPSSSKSSSQGAPSSLPFVPEVVQLDDDNQSLANTTLGELTAGRKPPRKKRLVDADVTMDSFEEESLYTMGITPRIRPSTLIDEDEVSKQSSSSRIQAPPQLNGVNVEYDPHVFFPDGGDSSEGDSPFKVPPSPMAPKIASLVEEALGAESQALAEEHRATGIDYGPLCDGASVKSYSSAAGVGTGTDAWPTQQLSPASSSTPKTGNVIAPIALPSHQDGRVLEKSDTVRSREKREGRDTSAMQLLEDEDQKSRVSPIDLQGTEQREDSPAKLLEDEDSKSRVSPIDLHDLDPAQIRGRDTMVMTALSTPVRSPRDLLSRKTYPWDPKPSFALTPRSAPHGVRPRSISPYRMRCLEGSIPSSPQSYHSGPAMLSLEPATPSRDGINSPKAFFTPNSVASIVGSPTETTTDLGESLRKLDDTKPGPTFPQFFDSSVASSSSSGVSSGNDNKWLFGAVAETLGPRTSSADMESLSGRSNRSGTSRRSGRSYRSLRSGKSRGSRRPRKRRTGGSVSSQGSRNSFGSYMDQKTASEISLAPRSLENDLLRLEQQLVSLKTEKSGYYHGSIDGTSQSVSGLSRSSRSSHRRVSSKQRVIVVVPPGKLGVILANRHDGKGTVVSELRPHSQLSGALAPGDRLIEIDGEDVTSKNVSEITSVMAAKSEKTRRLTVISSEKIRARAQDTHKHD